MFHAPIHQVPRQASDMSSLLDTLAKASSRPRYAFMVLNLIAEVARPDGSAGPFIQRQGVSISLRDWLSDALTPMGGRDPKRLALAARIRTEFEQDSRLAGDEIAMRATIDAEVLERVRASAKTNLSRAVSELVGAGLLRRHYQGYCFDHQNRGAQRHVVYTLIGRSKCLLSRTSEPAAQANRQGQPQLL